ncbi:MAG: DUF3782 domain-containing protein [Chloroflexota bacterium]
MQQPQFIAFTKELRERGEAYERELREFKDQQALHNQKTDRAIDRIDQSLNEFKCSTNKRFEEAAQERQEMRQDIKRLDHKIDDVENRLTHKIDDVENRLTHKIDDVENRLTHKMDQMNQQIRTDLRKEMDRFGQRWGIRNEALFRNAMKALLEKSFGVSVETKSLGPDSEQFDVIISNGTHILIEISSTTKANVVKRMLRKRALYEEVTGHSVSRMLYLVSVISLSRGNALQANGIEVVQPEEDDDGEETIEVSVT